MEEISFQVSLENCQGFIPDRGGKFIPPARNGEWKCSGKGFCASLWWHHEALLTHRSQASGGDVDCHQWVEVGGCWLWACGCSIQLQLQFNKYISCHSNLNSNSTSIGMWSIQIQTLKFKHSQFLKTPCGENQVFWHCWPVYLVFLIYFKTKCKSMIHHHFWASIKLQCTNDSEVWFETVPAS